MRGIELHQRLGNLCYPCYYEVWFEYPFFLCSTAQSYIHCIANRKYFSLKLSQVSYRIDCPNIIYSSIIATLHQ